MATPQTSYTTNTDMAVPEDATAAPPSNRAIVVDGLTVSCGANGVTYVLHADGDGIVVDDESFVDVLAAPDSITLANVPLESFGVQVYNNTTTTQLVEDTDYTVNYATGAVSYTQGVNALDDLLVDYRYLDPADVLFSCELTSSEPPVIWSPGHGSVSRWPGRKLRHFTDSQKSGALHVNIIYHHA